MQRFFHTTSLLNLPSSHLGPGLAGCNLSAALHLTSLLRLSLPWTPFFNLFSQGQTCRSPCLHWNKLSLATGTVPSLPSCYQSTITFPLFDFFPQETVGDSHNKVSSYPIPPDCLVVAEQIREWFPHDGLSGG